MNEARTFLEVFKLALERIDNGGISDKRKYEIVNAFKAIQLATIETRHFIKEKGFSRNTNLVQMWIDACGEAAKANIEDIPSFLRNKAMFWSEPQKWLNTSAIEIIPTLNDLDSLCESLISSVERRS